MAVGRGRPAAPALARGGGPLGWFWLKRHWAAARPGPTCRRMLPGTRRRGGTSCLFVVGHLAVEDCIIVIHQSGAAPSQRSGEIPARNEKTCFGRGRLTDVSPKPTDACGSTFAAVPTVAKALHTGPCSAALCHRTRNSCRLVVSSGSPFMPAFVGDHLSLLKRVCVGAHSLLWHQCWTASIKNAFVRCTTVRW